MPLSMFAASTHPSPRLSASFPNASFKHASFQFHNVHASFKHDSFQFHNAHASFQFHIVHVSFKHVSFKFHNVHKHLALSNQLADAEQLSSNYLIVQSPSHHLKHFGAVYCHGSGQSAGHNCARCQRGNGCKLKPYTDLIFVGFRAGVRQLPEIQF